MSRLVVLDDPPPMPSETLTDGRGGETTLREIGEGEVMLVNLWATWCAPCIDEMPTLGALQRRFEGRLRVIPVSVDAVADHGEAQAELARLSEYALPFYADPSRAILFSAQASSGMPVTILYDREGRELARFTGGADWSGPDAAALIEAALAG